MLKKMALKEINWDFILAKKANKWATTHE